MRRLVMCGAMVCGLASPVAAQVAVSPPGTSVEILEEAQVVSLAPGSAQERQLAWQVRLKTGARRVGLLWPVPGIPTRLLAAPERPFTQLAALAAPAEIEGEPELSGVRATLLCITLGVPTRDRVISEVQAEVDRPVFSSGPGTPPPPPSILDPADPAAIQAWLKDQQLAAPEGLEPWLATLAERGWRLVGVVWDNPNTLLESFQVPPLAVELSGPARALGRSAPPNTPLPAQVDLYIVGDAPQRVDGWDAALRASRPLPEARSALGELSPQAWFTLNPWLTHYHLDAPPWQAEAVELNPTADRTPLAPQAFITHPKQYIPLPLECFALLSVGAIGLWSWRRRKK